MLGDIYLHWSGLNHLPGYADKTDTQEVEQGETQEHAINLNTAGANSLYYMQLDSYGKQIDGASIVYLTNRNNCSTMAMLYVDCF